MEAVLLFVGAILGVVADRMWERSWPTLKDKMQARRRTEYMARASFVPRLAFPAVPAGLAQAYVVGDGGSHPLPLVRSADGSSPQLLAPDGGEPLEHRRQPDQVGLPSRPGTGKALNVSGRTLFAGTACYLLSPSTLFTDKPVSVTSADYTAYIRR